MATNGPRTSTPAPATPVPPFGGGSFSSSAPASKLGAALGSADQLKVRSRPSAEDDGLFGAPWTPGRTIVIRLPGHKSLTSIKRRAEDEIARDATKPRLSPAASFGSATFGCANGSNPPTPNGTSFAALADQAKQKEELYDFRKRLMHALIDIDESILFDAKEIFDKLVTYREFCEKVIMVNREMTKALFNNKEAFLATLNAPGLVEVYTRTMGKP